MTSVESVAQRLVGACWRNQASKRNAIPLALMAALTFLWCFSGSNTATTINLIGTRQEKYASFYDAEETTHEKGNGLTFTDTSSLANVTGVMDDSFQVKNLDVSKGVPCGGNKCFFRLKDNPDVGYLVQPDVFRYDKRTTHEQLFQLQLNSWEFAEQLRQENNIQHFLLEPPTKVKVTKKLAKQLNANIFSEAREVKYDEDRFKWKSTVFIQKVKLAPEPNIIIGCTTTKQGQFKRNAEEFFARVNDKDTFLERFSSALKQVKRVLKEEPCLFRDFQVLLDTSGQVYHLDFDRCFSSRDPAIKRRERKSRVNLCLRTIDGVEQKVKQIFGLSIDSKSGSSKR